MIFYDILWHSLILSNILQPLQKNQENEGAGVIACTEAKLRPFNSILICKMRPTAFQQLQANEDFSNTRGRANLCVSICTDEAHVACLHHWQDRHSRPCLRQCLRKINSSTRLVKATALGVRLRIGIFLLLTIFAIFHFSYRIEQIWNDMNRLVDELCKVPSKIKTHARLRCNGGLETQLWSMTSWSSWQSQKAISVSLPRSIQISTILYLSTSYAVSMLHLLKSGKTWVGICFFLKNQRPKQPKHIEFRCPNSKLPGKGLRASRQGHTLLTFCRV